MSVIDKSRMDITNKFVSLFQNKRLSPKKIAENVKEIKKYLSTLFQNKELSHEEIAENVKEIEEYLSTLPKDLLQQYKESTGKISITLFKEERQDEGLYHQPYDQYEQLTAKISPENELNLILDRFGHYETGTFRLLSKWNENTFTETNDYDQIIGSSDNGKNDIAIFKKEIFNLEKKLRTQIRNYNIINPVKNAITSILHIKKQES